MGKDEGLSLSRRYLPPPSRSQTVDPLFASCAPINRQQSTKLAKNTNSNLVGGEFAADMGSTNLVSSSGSQLKRLDYYFDQFCSFHLICLE